MKKCVAIVLDSLGAGAAPDAEMWGDTGADTLGHMAEAVGGLRVPNLRELGLGNLRAHAPLPGCPPVTRPRACYGRMREAAQGKDTATGHWEFMGLISQQPFRTFPHGFPDQFIARFVERSGCGGVLANRAASGTEIIREFGQEHERTRHPIVYTSADPVLQIAAHEEIVPLETLYRWCEVAFDLAVPEGLSRVIARPFAGRWPDYQRTWNRHDYAVPPPVDTFLDDLARAGTPTVGIGKIGSIYAGRGIAEDRPSKGNEHGVDQTLEAIREGSHPFVFTNLVDFDQSYGHRRDPVGYAECLAQFDARLPEILAALSPGDLLLLTADHGNDPTYRGTDHTREDVPLLALCVGDESAGRDLGVRATFADLGRTVVDFFGAETRNPVGTSFLQELRAD